MTPLISYFPSASSTSWPLSLMALSRCQGPVSRIPYLFGSLLRSPALLPNITLIELDHDALASTLKLFFFLASHYTRQAATKKTTACPTVPYCVCLSILFPFLLVFFLDLSNATPDSVDLYTLFGGDYCFAATTAFSLSNNSAEYTL